MPGRTLSSRNTSYLTFLPSRRLVPDTFALDQTRLTQANGESNGHAVDEEQILYMGNERFIGSELLFNPSDIGLNQSGLPETIAYVINQLPDELRGLYWANIGIFGGLGNVENLGERLERDLRAVCPAEYEIGIFEAYEWVQGCDGS